MNTRTTILATVAALVAASTLATSTHAGSDGAIVRSSELTRHAWSAMEATAPDHPHHSAGLEDELAQVRSATARFHRVDEAIAAGYELGWVNGAGNRIITGCVAHPTVGAMGYHYINAALMDDLAVDPLQPEALVYAPAPDGGLKLVAVEWIVRGPESNPPGLPAGAPPPTVLGMEMHILVPPPGPAFYLAHAWIWMNNPAGIFADWNPDVSCP